MRLNTYFFISLLVILSSCRTEIKFDKVKWAEKADLMTFSNRKSMINDLIKNYHLRGQSYKQIIELLGEPQSDLDSNFKIFYDVDIDYGSDIDPVYSKTLSFQFSIDSIVQKYDVIEWKK